MITISGGPIFADEHTGINHENKKNDMPIKGFIAYNKDDATSYLYLEIKNVNLEGMNNILKNNQLSKLILGEIP